MWEELGYFEFFWGAGDISGFLRLYQASRIFIGFPENLSGFLGLYRLPLNLTGFLRLYRASLKFISPNPITFRNPKNHNKRRITHEKE
ncbi:hypothetical protein D8M06_04070 [Oceanobacillus halophilus]|uniref:Uncharacterized protein n=1 Tax=Oceanobacillus halophilus TaxID=930130 RepID=A0A495ADC5_9BACI|nr:hypothetical protein D8M06_04070 [Oceanobacillus halophilus]